MQLQVNQSSANIKLAKALLYAFVGIQSEQQETQQNPLVQATEIEIATVKNKLSGFNPDTMEPHFDIENLSTDIRNNLVKSFLHYEKAYGEELAKDLFIEILNVVKNAEMFKSNAFLGRKNFTENEKKEITEIINQFHAKNHERKLAIGENQYIRNTYSIYIDPNDSHDDNLTTIKTQIIENTISVNPPYLKQLTIQIGPHHSNHYTVDEPQLFFDYHRQSKDLITASIKNVLPQKLDLQTYINPEGIYELNMPKEDSFYVDGDNAMADYIYNRTIKLGQVILEEKEKCTDDCTINAEQIMKILQNIEEQEKQENSNNQQLIINKSFKSVLTFTDEKMTDKVNSILGINDEEEKFIVKDIITSTGYGKIITNNQKQILGFINHGNGEIFDVNNLKEDDIRELTKVFSTAEPYDKNNDQCFGGPHVTCFNNNNDDEIYNNVLNYGKQDVQTLTTFSGLQNAFIDNPKALKELSTLQQKTVTLTSQLNELESKLNESEVNNEELRGNITALEKDLQKHVEEIRNITEQLDLSEEQKQKLNETINNAFENIENNKKENEKEQQDLKDKIKQLKIALSLVAGGLGFLLLLGCCLYCRKKKHLEATQHELNYARQQNNILQRAYDENTNNLDIVLKNNNLPQGNVINVELPHQYHRAEIFTQQEEQKDSNDNALVAQKKNPDNNNESQSFVVQLQQQQEVSGNQQNLNN